MAFVATIKLGTSLVCTPVLLALKLHVHVNTKRHRGGGDSRVQSNSSVTLLTIFLTLRNVVKHNEISSCSLSVCSCIVSTQQTRIFFLRRSWWQISSMQSFWTRGSCVNHSGIIQAEDELSLSTFLTICISRRISSLQCSRFLLMLTFHCTRKYCKAATMGWWALIWREAICTLRLLVMAVICSHAMIVHISDQVLPAPLGSAQPSIGPCEETKN